MGESEVIAVLLPYPVSANRYWRHVARGRRAMTIVSDEAVKYREQVALICAAHGVSPLSGPCEVALWLHPRTRKDGSESAMRIDLDNAIKVALDACQGRLFVNDAQVVRLVAQLGVPQADGGLTVQAKPWGEA